MWAEDESTLCNEYEHPGTIVHQVKDYDLFDYVFSLYETDYPTNICILNAPYPCRDRYPVTLSRSDNTLDIPFETFVWDGIKTLVALARDSNTRMRWEEVPGIPIFTNDFRIGFHGRYDRNVNSPKEPLFINDPTLTLSRVINQYDFVPLNGTVYIYINK